MDLTIVLIALSSVLFVIYFGLAVSNRKDRKLMLLNILSAVLSLVTAAISVCTYLKIP